MTDIVINQPLRHDLARERDHDAMTTTTMTNEGTGWMTRGGQSAAV